MPATQVWPEAMNAANVAPAAARSRSASGSTITGAFPPSSQVTRIRFSPASFATTRPVSVPPVRSSLRTPPVGAERRARFGAETGDDVDDAVRNPGVARDAREHERGQRRELGRLDDDGVAGGERRRELLREDQQRMVPRRELADDAERDAPHVVQVGAFERRHRILRGARDGGEVAVELGDARRAARASRAAAARRRSTRASPAPAARFRSRRRSGS